VNGVRIVLRALHRAEQHLVDQLTTVSECHRAEHEVHHVATDLAAWSDEHARRLADAAADRGLDLTGPPEPADGGVAAPPREAWGGSPEPGLVLLDDLRHLHLAATDTSLSWVVLAQAAQARRDAGLLALTAACHPQTLRQIRWTTTLIKTLSPQILTSL